MQKVSAQHYSPVRCFINPFDLTSYLRDNHLPEVKQKTGIAKSCNVSCSIKHTHFNPSAGEQLLAPAVQLEYFLEAPWHWEGSDGKLKTQRRSSGS